MNAKTKTIAGRKLTLIEGLHYRASRPMVCRERGQLGYPVTIKPLLPRYGARVDALKGAARTITTEPLGIYEADALLAAFNNSAMSFDGRRW